MLNQKIQNPNPDELMIEVDLCYELDPYELKLDEMIEAEPEPEMIEDACRSLSRTVRACSVGENFPRQ